VGLFDYYTDCGTVDGECGKIDLFKCRECSAIIPADRGEDDPYEDLGVHQKWHDYLMSKL